MKNLKAIKIKNEELYFVEIKCENGETSSYNLSTKYAFEKINLLQAQDSEAVNDLYEEWESLGNEILLRDKFRTIKSLEEFASFMSDELKNNSDQYSNHDKMEIEIALSLID